MESKTFGRDARIEGRSVGWIDGEAARFESFASLGERPEDRPHCGLSKSAARARSLPIGKFTP